MAELDPLIASEARPPARDFERCLSTVAPCAPPSEAPRTFDLRIALDPRYERWPAWEERLANTLQCINRLYRSTGVSWGISDLTPWDTGAQRHQLYALLQRLRSEFPGDGQTLVLGITVWEERMIYRMAGGEIGLSQAGACVVPSWPRVENDCLIVAHELGHLIGARHIPGKNWIMGWAARPFFLPANDPLARVAATYRFHPRNLAVIAAHRTARVTAHGLSPAPACRRRIAAIDSCAR